ncbi:MAG: hypothetical protein N3A38_16980 [Planctomycetota bacterium]|nr:hypothetical protein [Planctomycetota bacterium]
MTRRYLSTISYEEDPVCDLFFRVVFMDDLEGRVAKWNKEWIRIWAGAQPQGADGLTDAGRKRHEGGCRAVTIAHMC